MDLIIDKEFVSIIPELTDEVLKELEASLLADGCRDAIVVWGETIVDGHNRYSLCKKNSIEFLTRPMEFASRDEATTWILRNQIARRNLTPDQMSEVRGRLYLQLKGNRGGHKKVEYKNCTPQRTNAAEVVAAAAGVSRGTVLNDARYVESVEKTGKRAGGDVSKQDVIAEANGSKKPKAKKAEAAK